MFKFFNIIRIVHPCINFGDKKYDRTTIYNVYIYLYFSMYNDCTYSYLSTR